MRTTADRAAERVQTFLGRLQDSELDELLPMLALAVADGVGEAKLPANIVAFLHKSTTQHSLESMPNDDKRKESFARLLAGLHDEIAAASFDAAAAARSASPLVKRVAPPKVGQVKGGPLAQALSIPKKHRP